MAFKYAKTGPFILEKIITNDPTYLKLEFNDLNKVTNQKNIRQLSKGGRWPESFAIFLEEKANELLGKEVYVITSQTTKEWDTTKWLSDIESRKDGDIKDGPVSKIPAADGTSNVSDTLAFCKQNLIDFSLAKNDLSGEEEFLDFGQNLAKNFEQSWRSNKTSRNISDDVKRIRVLGPNNLSKRNGYRVIVWKAYEYQGINYFIVLKVDKKLEDESYPSNQEIKEATAKIEELKPNYSKEFLKKILDEVLNKMNEDDGEIGSPLPETTNNDEPVRVYLNCPFAEKDECKSLGGKWDNDQRKWYISEDVNKEEFQKWIT